MTQRTYALAGGSTRIHDDDRLNLGKSAATIAVLHRCKKAYHWINNMPKAEIIFEFEKETKNSVRYQEVPAAGQPPIVGSLYVQKWFAGDAKTLKVTVEKAE